MTFEEMLNDREMKGENRGRAESVLVLLSGHGEISGDLRGRILAEQDNAVLDEWLKIAATVTSIQQFREEINI